VVSDIAIFARIYTAANTPARKAAAWQAAWLPDDMNVWR
jgi:hypothetical protein